MPVVVDAQDVGVDCEAAREALSARLDGERQHVPAARVDAHLGSCPDCRVWLAGRLETPELAQAVLPGLPP